ncbi:hypothetical protein KUCAC02_011768, partial [Chaenocephalus aceratus]
PNPTHYTMGRQNERNRRPSRDSPAGQEPEGIWEGGGEDGNPGSIGERRVGMVGCSGNCPGASDSQSGADSVSELPDGFYSSGQTLKVEEVNKEGQ